MSATAERPKTSSNGKGPRSRSQVAEELLDLLTDEPQSEAALRRQVKEPTARGSRAGGDVIKSALGVLEAQHQAKRIPNTAGSPRGGWVRFGSPHEAAIIKGEDIKFPYVWATLPVDEMFIDPDYQRPLTNFVDQIVNNFNPVLFQTLAINDRGGRNKKHLAVIDGQTRWQAAQKLGVTTVPCVLFTGLSPEAEADIFWQLQKHRRGMVSWHRFRAALKAQRPEALAIQRLVETAGFTLGDGQGHLKAIAALETSFRRDEFALERALVDLHAAWRDHVPDAFEIKGMHYFLMNYPIGRRTKLEIEDERLVRRLATTGPAKLSRMASAIKESKGGNPAKAKLYGEAIENVYTQGGKSQ